MQASDVVLERFETPDEERAMILGDAPYVSPHFLGGDHHAR